MGYYTKQQEKGVALDNRFKIMNFYLVVIESDQSFISISKQYKVKPRFSINSSRNFLGIEYDGNSNQTWLEFLVLAS